MWTLAGRRLSLCALVSTLVFVGLGAVKRPIKRPDAAPTANAVALFAAAEAGDVEIEVIAKSAYSANVFVTNRSKGKLTVQFPDTAAARPTVLKQFFPQGAATGSGSSGRSGSGQQTQSIGGGSGQSNQSNNNANGLNAGGPFFSVDSGESFQITLKTVCLNHGLDEPRPKLAYTLVPTEAVSDNPVLHEMLRLYANSTEIDQKSAQAAAWHLANGMSWQQLKNKSVHQLGNLPIASYFTRREIEMAQRLVKRAEELAKARAENTDALPKI